MCGLLLPSKPNNEQPKNENINQDDQKPNNLTLERCYQADRELEPVDEKWYTSTRIRSKSPISFLTGRIEARIRVPAGLGLWAAFWMLPSNATRGNWAATGEVDIMEASVRVIVVEFSRVFVYVCVRMCFHVSIFRVFSFPNPIFLCFDFCFDF